METYSTQECIPVGCVPSVPSAVSGGGGASGGGVLPGGVLPRGVCGPGGTCLVGAGGGGGQS